MRGPAKVISVGEGVVALSSTAGATALFQEFSRQWRDCDGTTVTIGRPSIITDRPAIVFSDTISDVRAADSVLAATLSIDTQLPGIPSSGPRPEARAIGVRGNCLVEVEIAFFGSTSLSDEGSGDVHRSAIDIAHAMMDKVSGLTVTCYIGALAGWNTPVLSASSSARITCTTALISARWVNACGKLPRCRPVRGSISSA